MEDIQRAVEELYLAGRRDCEAEYWLIRVEIDAEDVGSGERERERGREFGSIARERRRQGVG